MARHLPKKLHADVTETEHAFYKALAKKVSCPSLLTFVGP
jgi:hypothetical protein